jgi:type IV pilus assembly protein PilC
VLRRVIADMVERLNAGATFAEAAAAHTEAFPSYYVGVLRSAELTGALDDTVDNLAAYLERDIEARSRIISAMVYPLVVLMMALGTITLLAFVVLPQFKDLFEDLDADLPFSTKLLLAFVTLFTELWFIPLGVCMVIAGFIFWMVRTPQGKDFRDRMVLRVPGLGTIVQYSILERFCRILSTMTTAGVPLPEAMEVVTDASNNNVFRERLGEAREAVMHGEGLARPLIETGLFPGAARQMLAVGEESGTIDRQLATAAQYFDRELDVRLKRFTSIFEPATIIFVGLTVGFVAIALVQAMYGMLGGLNE